MNTATANTTTEPARYLRVEQCTNTYGLSRAWLYPLLSNNTVKSVCLRKKGNIRGLRLVLRESLEAFIESQAGAFTEEASKLTSNAVIAKRVKAAKRVEAAV